MIEPWSEGCPDDHMAEDILVTTSDLVRRHPWWRARAELVHAMLVRLEIRPPARILDVGCGWGVTLESLEGAGYAVAGADVSPAALARLDGPGRRLIQHDLTRPPPDHAAPYDAVLALDVIEHIDDDRSAVAHLARLVRPGGFAIASVPARPELYSEFDRVQGHRRRYVPATLAAAFAGSGLELVAMRYWCRWLVPMLARTRRASRPMAAETPAETYRRHLRLPSWPAEPLIRRLFAREQARALNGKLRTGSSLFAIARR